MNRYKSPLRYPGGKQRLAPFIAEIMAESNLVGGEYAEPFAGGAGVAIELLLNGTASRVHLNDKSLPVYCFWRSILTKTAEFCTRISRASMTLKEWRRQKEILRHPHDHIQLDIGFSLFYLNRCNRSGIPTGGMIGGVDQTGNWKMDARFPRNELIRRIELIAEKRKFISVKNWDAEQFIKQYIPKLPRKTLVYCDPPYFHKSERLYLNRYTPEDHARLARTIQKHIKRPWLVSYDSVPQIVEHYSERRSFTYDLQYNAARAYKGTEIFFFSDSVRVPETSAVGSINLGLQLAEW